MTEVEFLLETKKALTKVSRVLDQKISKHRPNINILLATPASNGVCTTEYAMCLTRTVRYFYEKDITIEIMFLNNDCSISRARNFCVAKFLSDENYTHLLFVDPDIIWKPQDIEKLLKHDVDVVGGVYPKPKYIFERLFDIGGKYDLPKTNHNLLDYVIKFNENRNVEKGLVNVRCIGAGFMLIKKEAITKMIVHQTKYHDDTGCADTDMNEHMYNLFNEIVIDNQVAFLGRKPNTFLESGFAFCHRYQKNIGSVYADLSIKLSRVGVATYEGDISDTITIRPKDY